MNIVILIALLPVVFMIHDFEEIIFFQPWLKKNYGEFSRRFPGMARRVYGSYGNLSTPAFAVAVLHIFVAISVCTFLSLYLNSYGPWFGVFAIFFLHLFLHILQWLIWGRYVPFLITSLLALPYCLYTLVRFLKATDMHFTELILWTIAAAIGLVPLFLTAFYNAKKFEVWKRKTFRV